MGDVDGTIAIRRATQQSQLEVDATQPNGCYIEVYIFIFTAVLGVHVNPRDVLLTVHRFLYKILLHLKYTMMLTFF